MNLLRRATSPTARRTSSRTGLLAAAAALAVAVPSSASGAATVGQIAPTPGVGLCAGPTLIVTPQVEVSGPPGYRVPTGGGVLTSWSAQGPTSATAGDLRLKVVDPVAIDQFQIVAQDSLRAIAPNTVNTFAIRIPVDGGELIALWVQDFSYCLFTTTAPADLVRFRFGTWPEPTIGEVFPVDGEQPSSRTNVSARLEADADGDGYGDETQDLCPSDASTQGPCPSPPTNDAEPPTNDTDPPETEITKDPPKRTDRHKVKFKFVSNEPGSTFECKFDRKPFKPCSSPRKYKRLDHGSHKFKVFAIDPAGNVDSSPAKDKFRVVH